MALQFLFPCLNRLFCCFQLHSKAEHYLQAGSERTEIYNKYHRKKAYLNSSPRFNRKPSMLYET